MNIDQILEQRAQQYGDFVSQAGVSLALKMVLRKNLEARNKVLHPDQQEALEMILHKVARIVNGDPNYVDSWDDISGYALLVSNRLKKGQKK